MPERLTLLGMRLACADTTQKRADCITARRLARFAEGQCVHLRSLKQDRFTLLICDPTLALDLHHRYYNARDATRRVALPLNDPRANVNEEPSAQNLELAHYYDELEARIVHRLHTEASSEEARGELLRSTGVDDPQLINELSKLGITADELIALRLFPLVMVAWAEDHADLDEREAIRAEAEQLGICEDSTAWMMLDTWLRKRPPGLGVDAWKRYTHGTFQKMTPKSIEHLIELTEKQMTAVAKASGGHLGFGKVSRKESTMIERLVKTMREQV